MARRIGRGSEAVGTRARSFALATCPGCGLTIPLRDLKDFESFSKIEVRAHLEDRHPELLVRGPNGDVIGMPYTEVRFA